jgi:hypothetical protein
MAVSIIADIENATAAQPVIDTHEHTFSEEDRRQRSLDLLSTEMHHYVGSDLFSAGMTPDEQAQMYDQSRDPADRWSIFLRYWQYARTTGYGKALHIACRDLFSVDDLMTAAPSLDGYRRVNEQLTASQQHEAWYRYILQERGNIVLAIPDVQSTQVDRSIFVPAIRFDSFISVGSRADLARLERETGHSIYNLDDHVTALGGAFAKAKEEGMVTVKSGLAYRRILSYDNVPRSEAERIFAQIVSGTRAQGDGMTQDGLSFTDCKPLQDYMMHQVVRLCIEHGIPMQIHTGLHAGNGNIITNSNPTHLVNLFIQYPQARFDIFHAGYPYQSELATLAKNFQNVYVDLCWVHIISPYVARATLHEWLETIPHNKIFGFGGDYGPVELAYAHCVMARENIARVLSEKVEEGLYSVDQARIVGARLLHDNANEFFGLGRENLCQK